MEFDNQQQIWQRVRNPEPPREKLDLRSLVLAAGETEATLGRAAGYLGGSLRQQVLALARETGEETAALRGIHWLSSGKALPRKPIPAPNGNARELLRLCYFRCLQAQGEYTARTLEPQFGGIFHTFFASVRDTIAARGGGKAEMISGSSKATCAQIEACFHP